MSSSIAKLERQHWQSPTSLLLMAIVVLLLSVPEVNASCGDWLAHPDDATSHTDALIVLDSAPVIPAALVESPASDLPPLKTCSGTHCDEAPAPSQPGPSRISPSAPQETGCLAEEYHEASAQLLAHSFAKTSGMMLAPFRLGIERPPQI